MKTSIDGESKVPHNREKEYYEKDVTIVNYFGNYTTEQLIEFQELRGETFPGGVDLLSGHSEGENSIDRFLSSKSHQVITYRQGEGATFSSLYFEAGHRAVVADTVVVPIDLERFSNQSAESVVIKSLGRLVEVIERAHHFLPSSDYDAVVENCARIFKAGGREMDTFLRTTKGNRSKNSKAKRLLGLGEFIPISGRVVNSYVPPTKERLQFIKDVLRKRNVSAPKSIEEIANLIRAVMGKQAKDIYLTLDIPHGRNAQKILSVFTSNNLLDQLAENNIFIKVFTPKGTRVLTNNIEVTDNFFEWTDDDILKMIDTKFRDMGSWYHLRALHSEKVDLTVKVLEFANKNPNLAMRVVHGLLEVSLEMEGSLHFDTNSWNKMCDKWKHGNPRPKKI